MLELVEISNIITIELERAVNGDLFLVTTGSGISRRIELEKDLPTQYRHMDIISLMNESLPFFVSKFILKFNDLSVGDVFIDSDFGTKLIKIDNERNNDGKIVNAVAIHNGSNRVYVNPDKPVERAWRIVEGRK